MTHVTNGDSREGRRIRSYAGWIAAESGRQRLREQGRRGNQQARATPDSKSQTATLDSKLPMAGTTANRPTRETRGCSAQLHPQDTRPQYDATHYRIGQIQRSALRARPNNSKTFKLLTGMMGSTI